MTMVGLELQNLVKRFGDAAAVDGASFDVGAGEIVALLGPSGCGKTTTLRLIAGFERLDTGRILLDGSDLTALPPFRRGIGLVFQDYALFPHMTVADNIDYGMRRQGMPRAERAKRRADLLRLVRLERLGDRRPAALSGGQQQRVALARALAISPKLLLLDEPLSNLDAKLRETLRTELGDILRALGMTTLIVTHDQIEAIALADRIALMNKGAIVQVGSARDIYEQPATRFVADFIGQSLWFAGRFERQGAESTGRFVADDGPTFIVDPPVVRAARYGLSIRPEHVRLAARPSDANRMSAVVDRLQFLGAELVVSCRLDPGGRLIAIPTRTDEEAIPAPGDRIELGVAAARCRVVADE
jgi:putative spermidine/putrescine transport system ATP-binding protein